MAGVTEVRVERDEGIVTVTLERPGKLNAMDSHGWAALDAALTDIAHQSGDRVVVITGAGPDFCSGADLSEESAFDEEPLGRMRWIGRSALALHRLPQPVLAKVRGAAVGAGFNIALGCDIVIASESARFSQVFVRRGMTVDFGGSWLLPRLVGLQRAKMLAFLGEMVDAATALKLGLVAEVVSDDDLEATVYELAARLSTLPPIQLSLTKTLLNDSFSSSFEQMLEHESRAQALSLRSDDSKEAVEAFREKRPARFVGR